MIETPQLPPHNLEAEQSVLGAVLLDNRALAIAMDVLVEEHFYRTSHQKIFRTMAELSDGGSTYTILDGLVTQGEALRSGSGRRGDAFLYSRFVSVSPLRSVGPNETNPPTSPNDHEATSPGGWGWVDAPN
jgi:hypothetical protein